MNQWWILGGRVLGLREGFLEVVLGAKLKS